MRSCTYRASNDGRADIGNGLEQAVNVQWDTRLNEQPPCAPIMCDFDIHIAVIMM